jgi:hypothetical protein
MRAMPLACGNKGFVLVLQSVVPTGAAVNYATLYGTAAFFDCMPPRFCAAHKN